MTAEINRLYEAFHGDTFQFKAYFPNFSSKPQKIEAFRKKFNLQLDCKTDYFKTKAKKFGATVVPEVVVFDEENDRILYRGRIDNSYEKIGTRRRIITRRDLFEVLTAIRLPAIIEKPEVPAVGCFINFKDFQK